MAYLESVPGARVGIAAVDRVLASGGARRGPPALIEPRNEADATHIGIDRWLLVEGVADPVATMERLATLPEVEAATLDWVAFLAVVPADPLYSMHWGHNNTHQLLSYNWTNNNHETGSPVGTVGFDCNAQAAWTGRRGTAPSSVIIGIIDSGVQSAHPDLLQVTGFDFGDNDSNPDDNSRPAPVTAPRARGVAASRANSLGPPAPHPGCSIMPLKVANSAGTM